MLVPIYLYRNNYLLLWSPKGDYMNCDICGKEFNDVIEALNHMKEEHPKELDNYIKTLSETSGHDIETLKQVLSNNNLFSKIAKDVEKEKKKQNKKR